MQHCKVTMCVYALLLCPVWLLVTPWTVAHQAPLSMEFSRQENLCGLPFPSLGNLPNPGLLHCRQILYHLASLVAQIVNHLPTMWETWVRSLGWEDPWEKEMATHSSILVWKIPWTEESSRLQSMGSQGVRHYWVTSRSFPSELQVSMPSKCIIRCPF